MFETNLPKKSTPVVAVLQLTGTQTADAESSCDCGLFFESTAFKVSKLEETIISFSGEMPHDLQSNKIFLLDQTNLLNDLCTTYELESHRPNEG